MPPLRTIGNDRLVASASGAPMSVPATAAAMAIAQRAAVDARVLVLAAHRFQRVVDEGGLGPESIEKPTPQTR